MVQGGLHEQGPEEGDAQPLALGQLLSLFLLDRWSHGFFVL